jgi:multiple sugar transport system permease protein
MTTLPATKRQLPTPRILKEWLQGYLLASPFLVGFFVFTAYPMAYSIWLSFHKWNLLGTPKFVGFDNFIKVFTNPSANLSLYNSAFYSFLAVPIQLVISFTIAYALSQKIKFRDFYRAGFYMPFIVPIVATSVVWQRIFHPEFGILNDFFGKIGLPSDIAWLQEVTLAKPAFIFMSFWMIGRQMVIFIAGLGNIPDSLYEAASLDGAGFWRRMRTITIPMMTPLIFYNMVMAIINSFQSFVPAMIMTDGGPQNATLFAVLNIYRQGFEYFNVGYAAALSWEFFVIIVGFTIVQFVMSRRWVYYESD